MNKKIVVIAAVFGMLSVIIGAFGAHGLKPLISNDELMSYETGVKYQMYHALLLLFVGITNKISNKFKSIIFYLIVLGIVLFSGSIYGLSTNALTGFNFKSIAFMTPIGGTLLIASWLFLLIGSLRYKENKKT